MDPMARITGLTVFLIIIPGTTALLLLPDKLKPLVLVYLAIVIFLVFRHFYESTLYECPNCRHVFRPELSDFVLAPHQTYYKLLTCPNCGSVEWCPIKYYRGEELKIKLKPIREEVKTNLKPLLVFTTLVYLLSAIPATLHRNFALLIPITLIYLLYFTVIVYAIRKDYRSQIFIAMTFFIVIPMILFGLLAAFVT